MKRRAIAVPLPPAELIVQHELRKGVEHMLGSFRSFNYYCPEQNGSASIKAVLPALTGKGYDGLAIQEAGTASNEFLRVTFGDVAEEERGWVREQLQQYCGRDTEGMIWIIDAPRRI